MTGFTALGTRERLVVVMFDVVAQVGLDRLSVREVATRAEVSIGTVQHHFPSKDAMLAAAFDELVRRTQARIGGLAFTGVVRTDVAAVLEQLLPLDPERSAEARVHLAFAARAAVDVELGRLQRRTLQAVTAELAAALDARTGGAAPADAAALLLAGVDGLTLHAISAPGLLRTRGLRDAISALIDAVLPPGPAPR